MTTQPIPLDEVERLIELRSLGILDTPPEERFDRITRIAQRLFRVPIVLVSLVDEDRQWFKACVGLETEETPREVSFCAHAIMSDDVLHVPDALQDERFRENPLVTGEPKIRLYAGAPIESPKGHKLGTLCVIDREPRQLTDDDLATLRDLAALVKDEVAAVQLATEDLLTKLRNRRGFFLIGEQVLRFAKRMGRPVTLLFLDLDGLKNVNDTEGHEAGDRLIVEAARALRDSFRSSDVIARIAGDEFCVMLSGSSARAARSAVARFESALGERNELRGSGSAISMSIGLADWDPSSEESLDELVERADKRMYEHKRSKSRGE
jgi:diguanylate cyclase (GGDEF)-like protein